jgi:predicted NBD/HSP70 family sugar kinase
MNTLAIDLGGTHVKVLVSGKRESRKAPSGPKMTPKKMVSAVEELVSGWTYDRVSLGYPGLVVHGRIAAEPANLGAGWVGFNFAKAFGHPMRIVNDAAMQALGSYRGGSMLFLGLGTGLGSAMIVDGDVQPMELAHLPWRKGRTYEEVIGEQGLKRLGRRKWRERVGEAVVQLRAALEPDYLVIGGGNAKELGRLPRGVFLGSNAHAFTGGFRLWNSKGGRS